MLSVALVTAWTLLALALRAGFPEWLLLTHALALAALVVREAALPSCNRKPLAWELQACRGTRALLVAGTLVYESWAYLHGDFVAGFGLAVGAALLMFADEAARERVEYPRADLRVQLALLRLRGSRPRRALRFASRLVVGLVIVGLPLWAVVRPGPAWLVVLLLGAGLLGGIPWRRHPFPRTTAEALFLMHLPGESTAAMMLAGHLEEASLVAGGRR